MTRFETSRVNEMLGLQIGRIRDTANRLGDADLEELERQLGDLEDAVTKLKEMLRGLPHTA